MTNVKYNVDCVRDILKYAINNQSASAGIHGLEIKRITLSELSSNKNVSKYSKEEIQYSLLKMEEEGLLVLSKRNMARSILILGIVDITANGHRFYNAVKEDTIWNKTKSIAKQVGVHTLSYLEETAQKCAVTATATIIGNQINNS